MSIKTSLSKHVANVLVDIGLVNSHSLAYRLIREGDVRVNGVKNLDPFYPLDSNGVYEFQVGREQPVKVEIKDE